MNIKRQGFFREMPHGEDSDPSIRNRIGKIDSKIVKKVCKYLENGIKVISCAGTVDDIIKPERGTAGIPSILTDGIWYWPGDLAYYVKNYNVSLSSEFIETMQKNDWKILLKVDDIDFNNLSVDGEFLFRE